MLTFQNRPAWWRAGVPISLSCRHRAAPVQFHLPEGWLDMRDLGAVLEHEEPRPLRHVIKLSEPRPCYRVSLATCSSASVAYFSATTSRRFVIKGSLIPRARRRQCLAVSLGCAVVNICIIICLMRDGNNAFGLVQPSREEQPGFSSRCKLSAVALVVLCLRDFLESDGAAFEGCKHLRSEIRRREPM
jgi:hypothetical protein